MTCNDILEALGGSKFVLTTGAKEFSQVEVDGLATLMFTLPSRYARKKINRVRIEEKPNGTFQIGFYAPQGALYYGKLVDVEENVELGRLQEVFVETTQLEINKE